MSPQEQETILRTLATTVTESLIRKIRAGKVPADWDGHELRFWFFEESKRQAQVSTLTKDKRRRNKFLNDCAVLNL